MAGALRFLDWLGHGKISFVGTAEAVSLRAFSELGILVTGNRATNNMFQLIRNHRQTKISNQTETVAQLKRIQLTIQDLEAIMRETKVEKALETR